MLLLSFIILRPDQRTDPKCAQPLRASQIHVSCETPDPEMRRLERKVSTSVVKSRSSCLRPFWTRAGDISPLLPKEWSPQKHDTRFFSLRSCQTGIASSFCSMSDLSPLPCTEQTSVSSRPLSLELLDQFC